MSSGVEHKEQLDKSRLVQEAARRAVAYFGAVQGLQRGVSQY